MVVDAVCLGLRGDSGWVPNLIVGLAALAIPASPTRYPEIVTFQFISSFCLRERKVSKQIVGDYSRFCWFYSFETRFHQMFKLDFSLLRIQKIIIIIKIIYFIWSYILQKTNKISDQIRFTKSQCQLEGDLPQ